jgi:hypothetical protein
MNLPRDFFLLATLLAVAAGPAWGQTTAPPAASAKSGAQGAASIPDFSGIWRHGSLPWLVPPASGPGPVTNKARRRDTGVSDYGQLVGDYANPILQPWAAQIVKKKGEQSIAGIVYPNPANQCWPEPVPFLFKHMAMQMLQLPDRIAMLFSEDHEVRWMRLNEAHPAKVTPSWHGDAVGRYEGATLVVDTIGVRTDHPFAMIDLFGTPYTEKLHVVERYRLIDYEEAKDSIARAVKENWRPRGPPNPNYKDKYLEVHFTIEDEGAFTTPWTASMIYLRDRNEWEEVVCAENIRDHFENRDTALPKADKPDF